MHWVTIEMLQYLTGTCGPNISIQNVSKIGQELTFFESMTYLSDIEYN